MQEPNEDNNLNSEKKKLNNYIVYTGIGFQMFAVIALFTFVGYQIDKKREGGTPMFTAILSLIGVFISLYQVIRSLKKLKP